MIVYSFSAGHHLSDDPITGMLDTESPAMESNGDAFLPVLSQTGEWSTDQVAPENLTSILPEGSVVSQDASVEQQLPNQQMNSTELGSVEKAVEEFKIANAQLFQEEQPPLPPLPPQPTEEQPSEDKAESAESQQHSQEMTVEAEAAIQAGTQGKQNSFNCCYVSHLYI